MNMGIHDDEKVTMADVSQNWPKVERVVKGRHRAIVMYGDKPAYVIMELGHYTREQQANSEFEALLNRLTTENLPVIKRLDD